MWVEVNNPSISFQTAARLIKVWMIFVKEKRGRTTSLTEVVNHIKNKSMSVLKNVISSDFSQGEVEIYNTDKIRSRVTHSNIISRRRRGHLVSHLNIR